MPHQHELTVALNHFEYRSDTVDTWLMYERIDSAFSGDCEDFAFTLQNQIGGDVWYAIIPEHGAHAMLVLDGVVYDNMHSSPRVIADVERSGERLFFVMDKERVVRL